MTSARIDFDTVISSLGELHTLLDRLRGEFVHGIKTPAEYERAAALLDELTDGRKLSKLEETILVALENEMLAYQRDSQQFRDANRAFQATCTPVQLLRDLMDTLDLTGSDLPEIGDKTAVSKVLNGSRPISHKMAYALANRFAMEPGAFVSSTEPVYPDPGMLAVRVARTAAYVVPETTAAVAVKEADAAKYEKTPSKSRTRRAKDAGSQ